MNEAQAHARVASAVRKGVLVRKPCEVCGSEPADAHHEDYSTPLDVWWLCRMHHFELHRWRRLEGEAARLREIAARRYSDRVNAASAASVLRGVA